ncbi:ubiquitin-conjugating enzyme E2 S-like [Papilio machaon]|uniref:ubiquitin-conjugating enzyme E2 S-like n=1 Tax=Papilio machaon TaxID=76193 RepID=UPI001E664516|nr:ubiquitin-conjugating enzyme E2 S-like [Papilio machaon]
MSNVENVCPQVLRGVVREVRRLAADPPAGIKLLLRDNDITDVVALIDGPADTPYAGGVFRVRLALGREFPAAPPRAYFLTKIFHPNVSAAGEVCVNTLKRDWRPELGLAHALLAVRCLLIAPNADSALNAEAAALLRDRYDDYFARAKLYTDIHARPDHAHSAHAHKQEYRDVEVNADQGGEVGGEAGGEAGGEGAESGEGAPRPKRERRTAGARDTRRILKRL